MTTIFEHASRRQQLGILRSVAQELLQQYPIKVRQMKLRNVGHNATFQVSTGSRRDLGLRINVNSIHDRANQRAEAAWLEAISGDTDLIVPRPVRSSSGLTLSSTRAAGRVFDGFVYEWLEGRITPDPMGLQTARTLGMHMATLHDHAVRFRLPRNAKLPGFSSLLWNQADRLHADNTPLRRTDLRVVDRVIELMSPAITALLEDDKQRPIHSDLHSGNLVRTSHGLAVIDFDDCGIGVPAQDIGVAAFYQDAKPRFMDALYAGYTEIRSVPNVSESALHALLAQRNLILLNDLLANQTAELRAMVPKYIRRSITRLRHYRDTGHFKLMLPGLEPL